MRLQHLIDKATKCHTLDKCPYDIIANCLEEYEIYGAIWTDKGLIYVAKMNEKGEISSRENPTKLYAIKGSDYAITTDY